MTDQSANLDKRVQIIRAARTVFSEKDFHDATVEEVAEIAKVGKGTVYLYFPSKEALYVEVIKDGILELENEVERGLRGIVDPSRKIERIVEIDFRFVQENDAYFKSFARGEVQIMNLLGDLPRRKMALLDHQLNLITETIQEGIEAGQFRKMNPRIAAMALQGIVLRFALMHVVGNLKEDLLGSSQLVTSLFLRGIHSNGGSSQ
jgi:TetR/AcrR family fatty acid metabolism transcriptional regulator